LYFLHGGNPYERRSDENQEIVDLPAPEILLRLKKRGRASPNAFPGGAWEREENSQLFDLAAFSVFSGASVVSSSFS
jgi:hypothetical protein